MQPYFMPYIGYISLVKHVDRFILFDPVQFIRHGWIERNRILKQNEGWKYIQVPLEKRNRETLIKDIKINNSEKWKDKIIAQIQHYKKRSPYYFKVISILNEVFSEEFLDVVSLNEKALSVVCSYLGITTPIDVFSRMNLQIVPVNAPDEWALNICKAIVGVDAYWNPSGGIRLFDKSKYDLAGINLKFLKTNCVEYDQKREKFEPDLSILDVLMFNSPKETNELLDQYTLIQ